MNGSFRECPKGPKCAIISERITAGLPIVTASISGTIQLTRRIDNCIGFRVRYMGLSKETPMNISNGTLLILQSSVLGGRLATNPFQLALSTDQPSASMDSYSSVIAVMPSVVANEDRSFPDEVNRRMIFNAPVPIEAFDWTLSTLQGTFNINTAFALELIIEFYQQCQC